MESAKETDDDSNETDDDSDSKSRSRKRARSKDKPVYIAPELGPLIIQPGKKPLNKRGLPQVTKEFVENKLFHSILNHEIIVEDFNSGFDSDGAEDHDVEWRLAFKRFLLHDFVDMFAVEKVFMNLWNQFALKEFKITSDKCVYPALHAFLDKYGPEIRRIRFEILFVRHVTVLSRCGLVDADGVNELFKKLKKIEPCRKVHPDFTFGLNMLQNEGYVPKTYTTAQWCKSIEDPADDIPEDHFNSRSLFPHNPYSSKVVGVPGRSSFAGNAPSRTTITGPCSHNGKADGPCAPLGLASENRSAFSTGGRCAGPDPMAKPSPPAANAPMVRPACESSTLGTPGGQPPCTSNFSSHEPSGRPGAFVASPSVRPVSGPVGGSPGHIATGRVHTPDKPSPPRAVSPPLAGDDPSARTNVMGMRRSMHPAAGPPTPRAARRGIHGSGGPNSGKGDMRAIRHEGGPRRPANGGGTIIFSLNIGEPKEDSDGVVIISD